MDKFTQIYDRAVSIKGGREQLEQLLPSPRSPQELKKTGDDRYLSEMTKCIFRAGFVWKIIEAKWENFETAFKGFNPKVNAMMSDEYLEQLASDASIVRNFQKIKSVRDNAQFVLEIGAEHSSFGAFISQWPQDDMVGLFGLLKKRGQRLGGHTCQYFLRFMGKDTYMFSTDVVKVLIQQGIVSKQPTTLKDLQAVQDAFEQWRTQSGRPLCQISRIMAASVA